MSLLRHRLRLRLRHRLRRHRTVPCAIKNTVALVVPYVVLFLSLPLFSLFFLVIINDNNLHTQINKYGKINVKLNGNGRAIFFL